RSSRRALSRDPRDAGCRGCSQSHARALEVWSETAEEGVAEQWSAAGVNQAQARSHELGAKAYMPRKGHIAKRTVAVDALYGSDLVTKFINSMMWQGRRSTAEAFFYEALERMQKKGGDEALKLFKKAFENSKPLLEVKS